ncbi:GAF and ANTAR domain-containing protein [Amycolatopsis sp. cmx-11-12]|uniref:GAF and ANTAR domain-containing protein n=1 Tax=Amycolatopsis sp. cmx-11-12 TaxID=2785795 RepID=UPI003918452D
MSSPDTVAGEGLGAVLGTIARTLQAEPDVDTTLTAIVTAAVNQVTGTDCAGISLIERGKIRTVAPTDDVVTAIDEVQYRTGQGPCVDAIAEHQIFRTGDLTAETRWPAFTPAATATGMRSMLAYRLFVSDTTLGSLNLYSRSVDAFSDQTERDGHVFASHAAIALTAAQTEAELQVALEHRDDIGMAKGILMELHGIDPVQAFRMLVESSQHTNMKLHKIAAWVVEHHRELQPAVAPTETRHRR